MLGPMRKLNFAMAWLLLVGIGIAAVRRTYRADTAINPIGSSYFDRPHEMMLGNPIGDLIPIVFMIVYLLTTMLFGLALLNTIWRNIETQSLEKYAILAISFFPGYLVVVAVNRITTVIFPKNVAHVVLSIVYLTGVIISAHNLFKECRAGRASFTSWRTVIGSWLVLLIALAVALVSGVQRGSNHVLGDGALFSIELLETWGQSKESEYFPLVAQHYDEPMYLLPVFGIFSSSYDLNPYDFFWLLYAFSRTATFFSMFLGCRLLRLSKYNSLLTSMLFAFTTLVPNPFSAPLLFDSGTNIHENLHVGRQLTISLVVVFVAFAASGGPFSLKASRATSQRSIHFLIGIGLASITTSLVVAVGLLLLVLFAARSERHIKMPIPLAVTLSYAIIALSVSDNSKASGLVLLTVGAISFSWISRKNVSSVLTTLRGKFDASALFVGMVIGFLVFGNVTAPRFTQLSGLQIREFVFRGVTVDIGRFGENTVWQSFPLEHNLSLANFLAFFGLPIAAFCLTQVLTDVEFNDNGPVLRVLLTSVACLALGFFMWDFMNGGINNEVDWIKIWVKSRLVEPWFFASTLLGISLLLQAHSVLGRRILEFYITVSLLSLLPGGVLGQGLENTRFVLSLVKATLLN